MKIQYYKNELPQINDIIMAKIETIIENGSNLSFPEYCNCLGFVTDSELYFRKNKRVQKVKVNDLVPMIVLSVDTDKKFVLVSRKRVREEEDTNFRIKYRYATNINKLCKELLYLYCNFYGVDYDNMEEKDNIVDDVHTYCENYEENENSLNNDRYKNIYFDMLLNTNKILDNEYYDEDFLKFCQESLNSRIKYKKCCLETVVQLSYSGSEYSPMSVIKDVLSSANVLATFTSICNPPLYKIVLNDCYDKDINDFVSIMDNVLDDMQNKSSKYSAQFSIVYKNKLISNSSEDMVEIKFLSLVSQ